MAQLALTVSCAGGGAGQVWLARRTGADGRFTAPHPRSGLRAGGLGE